MTKPAHDELDDRFLRQASAAASPPRLLAGRHQQDLRRALMNESRRRSADARAATGAAGFHSWLMRLAYALGVVIVVGLCGWLISREHGSSRIAISDPSNPNRTSSGAAATTNPLSSGLSALLSSLRSHPNSGNATAGAIHDAVDSGSFAFLGAITAKNRAGRVYIYLLKLDDGRNAIYASDDFLIADPLLTVVHDRDLQEAITREKGHLVGESATEIGSKIYRYRVDLGDGTQEIYASDREPDVGKQQRHQQELDRLMSSGRGQIYKTIAGQDGITIYLIGVKLSDGTVKLYASRENAQGK